MAPLRPIICPAIVLVVFMSGPALAVTQEQIKFIDDQRPDADIPREAHWAGTKPDSNSKMNPQSNISFGVVYRKYIE